jgi:hypothetical protein
MEKINLTCRFQQEILVNFLVDFSMAPTQPPEELNNGSFRERCAGLEP